ncbi:hypothetical protein EDC04DRAFT_2600240 [Pisolithus marmoratus]|nr:hypothetical protein EDC04DRAFT_2600240 [Pisolithus marmoratus]
MSAFSTSQLDEDSVDGVPKCCAPCGTHKKTINVLCLAWYPKEVQEILKYAHHALAHEMILNLGWLHDQKSHMAWKVTVCESLMLVNAEFNTNVEMTKEIGMVVMEFSEMYVVQFFITEDNGLLADPVAYSAWKMDKLAKLKDQTNPLTFFMHEHNNKGQVIRWFGSMAFEGFHLTFWYMQTVSPVKFFPNNYKMMPTPMYALSTVAVLQHNILGPTFISHLDWLSVQGMKRHPNNPNLPRSPKKVTPVFIPPLRGNALLPTCNIYIYLPSCHVRYWYLDSGAWMGWIH